MVGILLVSYGCKKTKSIESQKKQIDVGLVFDVGGRGDKSFNDAAYKGVEVAKEKLGINFDYIEPGEGADRETALRGLAAGKYTLIFGIGFLFTDDITHIANTYPQKKFACVDYVISDKKIPENLVALKFREEEGCFLVGAIAGLVTKTNTIGFVGGMNIPLIKKFEAGYKEGSKTVNKNIKILISYAGVTPEAFKNPAKGKELALSQYNQGADIIFHASGSTGLGVFEAAIEKKKLAIGVDSDQYEEAPGYVLTSMIKKVDVAVYKTIENFVNNKFKGGIVELGLKEDGVGYVYNEKNKNLIPENIIKIVEDLRKKIIAGEIKIPKS